MSEEQTSILAIITTNREKVKGGAPIFIAENNDKLQSISMNIAKIMDASAHEVEPETMIIVKH